MQTAANWNPSLGTAATRTLVVADWKAEPQGVVAACLKQSFSQDQTFTLVVPASLHGVDWVGDPYANVPCATRAVAQLERLSQAAGLPVDSAEVGDHDPVAAIIDAVLSQQFDRILVCGLRRRIGAQPFDLAHRAGRATGLPVISAPIPAAAVPQRGSWRRLRRGECSISQPPAVIGEPVYA
jgi:hypothetical protein